MRSLLVGLLLSLVGTSVVQAQQSYYWVYLRDKAPEQGLVVSPQTIENRLIAGLEPKQESDLRPAQRQIMKVAASGAKLRYVSKWLNAVSIEADPVTVMKLQSCPEVLDVSPFQGQFYPTGAEQQVSYMPAMDQMQIAAFVAKGLNGKGLRMGLIDAGFRDADQQPTLAHVVNRKGIKAVRDFVDPKHTARFFRGSGDSLDTHGATVFRMVAGYDSVKNRYSGAATGPDFWLARTDDARREYRAEEDQWLAALEWMDSSGVRLINSSLGYGKGFDNPKDNYVPTQMDGKTTAVSKAARMAVEKKGIMLVISAGNEGNDAEWRLISSPADVDGLLTVGATLPKPYRRANYSGIGPEFLPYVKPDVTAYSLTGTSFSAPAVAGFVACVMQAYPKLSNKQLVKLMQETGNLYPYPNNYMGYGIANAERALARAAAITAGKVSNEGLIKSQLIKVQAKTFDVVSAGLTNVNEFVVFHKKNQTHVLNQEEIVLDSGKAIVNKPDGARFTTVMLPDQVIEIEWQ